MRRLVVLSMLVALPSLRAAAQETRGPDPSVRISPAFGVHYGSPLRGSLAVGVLIDREGKHNDGFIAMIEPGQQGTELSAGYFKLFGSFGSGYSVRAAVVRTREEPWNANPLTTYVGAELNGMLIFGVGGRVGFLRRASSSENNTHDTLASIGISIGG